jgi:hypothetical protein
MFKNYVYNGHMCGINRDICEKSVAHFSSMYISCTATLHFVVTHRPQFLGCVVLNACAIYNE